MSVTNLLGLADYQRPAADAQPRRRATPLRIPTGGKRISNERANEVPLSTGLNVLGQLSADEFWRSNLLDSQTLDRVPAWRLMELLSELSPEISRARWDFLRMCNPGWSIAVYQPNSETEDTASKALVQAFFDQLGEFYGAADVAINRLFTALFLRGGAVAELVLDRSGRAMVDLATPDPRAFDFEEKTDPVRGTIYQLGQWQNGQFRELNFSTVRYVPLDPLPGNPRGIGLVSSALFSTLFLIGLLHDLRRVIAQQGWPRLDLALDLEAFISSLPDQITSNPEQFKEAVDTAIAEIAKVYSALEPDDTYVHTSTVSVNRPVGAVDSSSLGAIDGVIAALERMSARALKTMPLMLGLDAASNEGQANRQWEIYAAGIKSVQHLIEQLLERLLTVGLRAAGKQATIKFRFAELRAAEMLRDAQTEALRIRNEKEKYAAGWTSQDEGSQVITGHPADQPEPRQTSASAGVGGLISANPDPGANRTNALRLADSLAANGNRNAAALALLVAASVDEPGELERQQAESLWRRFADEDFRNLIDAEVIE